MKRVQRSRQRGDRLPPKTVCCTRPGPLGNVFVPDPKEGILTRVKCIRLFKLWVEGAIEFPADRSPQQKRFMAAFEALERNPPEFLACYCGPADKCHVDVIIDILNQRKAERDATGNRA